MLKFRTVNFIFLLIVIAILIGSYFLNISLWIYLIIPTVWITITAIGSFQIKLNYFVNSLNHNYKQEENVVSITFDDGPNDLFTMKVLELLKKYDAKATFFLVGKRAEAHAEVVKQIVEEGHTIGNHSYSHSPKIGFFSANRLKVELEKTDAILKSIIQKTPRIYRPPYGVTNPNIRRALKQTNHYSIGWSKRSFDTTSLSEEKIFKRVTSNLKGGDIILLHDNSMKTLVVLERLLLFLKSNGLKSVPVDYLLKIEAYA